MQKTKQKPKTRKPTIVGFKTATCAVSQGPFLRTMLGLIMWFHNLEFLSNFIFELVVFKWYNGADV